LRGLTMSGRQMIICFFVSHNGSTMLNGGPTCVCNRSLCAHDHCDFGAFLCGALAAADAQSVAQHVV
jgi:hypothetical protein